MLAHKAVFHRNIITTGQAIELFLFTRLSVFYFQNINITLFSEIKTFSQTEQMKTLLQFNHRGEQIFAFALTRSSFQNHGCGSPSKVNTSEAISSGETILIRQENKKREGDVLSVVGMWKCENKQRKVSTRQVSSRLSETRLCQEMAVSRKN